MLAYVDTSVIVAITFEEGDGPQLARQIGNLRLASSPLLEAEMRSACRRERRTFDSDVMRQLAWVHCDRPLSPELDRVFEVGYVRGADAWHLATALYLAPNSSELTFLTLDARQRAVAERLGFTT